MSHFDVVPFKCRAIDDEMNGRGMETDLTSKSGGSWSLCGLIFLRWLAVGRPACALARLAPPFFQNFFGRCCSCYTCVDITHLIYLLRLAVV